MLRSQLEILSEQANANPYVTTDSDVEEAYPFPLELLDSDQGGDSDIEVDWRYRASVDTRNEKSDDEVIIRRSSFLC